MMSRASLCGATFALVLIPAAAFAQPEPTPDEGTSGGATEAPVEGPVEATATAEASTTAETPASTDEAPAGSLAPKLSGHVAATYNYNFTDPAGGVNQFHSYDGPAYTKANSALLNQAHVALTGNDDRLAYDLEIDAGTDALFNSGGSYFDIQEAWASYTTASGLGFKAGKFVTFNGIEVIEATSNPTISRGFLFGLAEPATHVGALGTYKVSDTLDVALGLVNGWDRIVDNNDNKTILAKVGITQEKLLATISAYAGKENDNTNWRTTLDATAVLKMTNLDLWLQANVGREEVGDESALWFGAAVEPVYKVDDKLSIGARGELFSDGDGVRTTTPDGVMLINASVAPAYKLHPNLTVRAEGRLDFATEDVYVNSDGDAGAIQIEALTEAIVTF